MIRVYLRPLYQDKQAYAKSQPHACPFPPACMLAISMSVHSCHGFKFRIRCSQNSSTDYNVCRVHYPRNARESTSLESYIAVIAMRGLWSSVLANEDDGQV